jgi:serine/threonine protein kinase
MNDDPRDVEVPAVPDHVLVRRVGAGSYGDVWLGRSVTGAYRAVKVVHRRSFASDRPYEREFGGILKFEPISRTHPGLVSVLHVGRNDDAGYFYYVMEVADDLDDGQAIDPSRYVPRTLNELLRHGPIPLPDCIELGIALADAVNHVHSHGLVHRDIKPSNIIFVNELPKLADIGLVTDIGEKATFVGTEGYIPPEGPGSPAGDLFSLGKVLYETSTGLACDRFPELPAKLRQQPEVLAFAPYNTILLRACESNPARRFTSAANLQEALVALRDFVPGQKAPIPEPPVEPTPKPSTGRRAVILFVPEEQNDVRLACVLEERLRAAGFEVCVDDREKFNVAWGRRMEAEIREAEVVVILVSSAAARDEIMAYQVDLAVRAQAQPRGPRVVPVALALKNSESGGLDVSLESFPSLSWMDETDDARLGDELISLLSLWR